jgi:hypothetical protein
MYSASPLRRSVPKGGATVEGVSPQRSAISTALRNSIVQHGEHAINDRV